jgi:seryl-tRNA synthetase
VGVSTNPYEQFRQALFDAKLLVDTGVPGLYLRSGTFESIVQGIDRLVSIAGSDYKAPTLHFPLVMARSAFEQSDYMRSFPDLMGSIHIFEGGDAEHAELLQRIEDGLEWSNLLAATDVVLCSAACHPLYPTCSGVLPEGGMRYEIFGNCFRHEPSVDPARMQAFRQHEFVYLGTPEGAEAHRDTWVKRGLAVLAEIGLNAEAVVANDPFFGRAGRILAAGQRSADLKYELVYPICSVENPTAIVSANLHQDHFSVPFDITTSDGELAHTACVGFGVERITLALLATHGLDPATWPNEVQQALWP